MELIVSETNYCGRWDAYPFPPGRCLLDIEEEVSADDSRQVTVSVMPEDLGCRGYIVSKRC